MSEQLVATTGSLTIVYRRPTRRSPLAGVQADVLPLRLPCAFPFGLDIRADAKVFSAAWDAFGNLDVLVFDAGAWQDELERPAKPPVVDDIPARSSVVVMRRPPVLPARSAAVDQDFAVTLRSAWRGGTR